MTGIVIEWQKMADKRPEAEPSPNLGLAGGFEDTRTEILAEAARGNWDRFFEQYLEPCWRELVLVCRTRGIALSDAEDFHQEFLARLMQDGRFGGRTRRALSEHGQAPDFRGNMPARYLRFRESSLRSAKFRNYLKRAIRLLVAEQLRRSKRQSAAARAACENDLPRWVNESVSRSLDRRWALACLEEAVTRFSRECAAARTRGRRRLFAVLYLNTVVEQSHDTIAKAYGVHRTTVVKLLAEARERLVLHLREVSGLEELEYLRELLGEVPDAIKRALDQGVLPDLPASPSNDD